LTKTSFYCYKLSIDQSVCFHDKTVNEARIRVIAGGPRDAAVHFDTYRVLQRHGAVSLPQHGFPV